MLEVALEEALLPFQMDGNIHGYVLIVSEKLHFSENQQPNYAAPGPVWWSKTCPRAAPLKLGREIQGHFCHGQSNFLVFEDSLFSYDQTWLENPSPMIFNPKRSTSRSFSMMPDSVDPMTSSTCPWSSSASCLLVTRKNSHSTGTGPWQKTDQQIRYQQGCHSPVCRLTFWTILGFRYATGHPVVSPIQSVSVSKESKMGSYPNTHSTSQQCFGRDLHLSIHVDDSRRCCKVVMDQTRKPQNNDV